MSKRYLASVVVTTYYEKTNQWMLAVKEVSLRALALNLLVVLKI